MSKTNTGPAAKVARGRPKGGADTVAVTLTIPRADSQLAESLVVDFDRLALGLRHNRLDVLRAAITRGLESFKTDIANARAKP